MPRRHRHVLFDLDGTLVDTRASVTSCYRHVFRECLGRDFPPPGIETGALFAMRPRELFARVAPEFEEELFQAYQSVYPSYVGLIRIFPGAADLVAKLEASDRILSLVTNKGIERTRIDLSIAGIVPESFAAIVTAEDTEERKPHPAPILLGLERAGASAGEAVYVGDGPQDMTAARAAGIDCVAVSYGFYDGATLAAENPVVMVDSIAALAEALGVAPAQEALP